MGASCTKGLQEDANERALDVKNGRILKVDAKEESKFLKLLLLGAGESGKSTIFKQIKVLFQKGFNDLERGDFKPVIHANVYQSIRTLVIGCKEFAESEKVTPSKFTLLPENQEYGEMLSNIESPDGFPSLDEENALKVQSCWRDPAIKAAFERGNELQLPDCTKFFLDNVWRLAGKDYKPTQEDILYARQQTTGIIETVFSAGTNPKKKGTSYRLFDVGGQRNERRKWIHLFEGVTAIIFCAALSDYDQMLLEDETKNRMMETRDLFIWLLQQPWFENTCFIVFLNKFDLFKEKVLKVPLSVCDWFQDYRPLTSSEQEVEHAYDYVRRKFQVIYNAEISSDIIKPLRIYKTTAIDEHIIRSTFEAVNTALDIKLLKISKLL